MVISFFEITSSFLFFPLTGAVDPKSGTRMKLKAWCTRQSLMIATKSSLKTDNLERSSSTLSSSRLAKLLSCSILLSAIVGGIKRTASFLRILSFASDRFCTKISQSSNSLDSRISLSRESEQKVRSKAHQHLPKTLCSLSILLVKNYSQKVVGIR